MIEYFESSKVSLSLNNGLDIDHLHEVYQHKVAGRRCGKTVAYATYILGVLEVNPQCDIFYVIGPDVRFINYFQIELERIAKIMGVPYSIKNIDTWTIAYKKVKFCSYDFIYEKAIGNQCIIIDVNDNYMYFDPCFYDAETICDHIKDQKGKLI